MSEHAAIKYSEMLFKLVFLFITSVWGVNLIILIGFKLLDILSNSVNVSISSQKLIYPGSLYTGGNYVHLLKYCTWLKCWGISALLEYFYFILLLLLLNYMLWLLVT